MAARSVSLALACLWAVGAIGAVAYSEDVAVRAAVCLPLALYWPGHAFLHAIRLPRRSGFEWHSLAAILSIVWAVPGGFLLAALGKLGPMGWVGWFAGGVVCAASVAMIRGAAEQVQRLPWSGATVTIRVGPCCLLVLALLVTGSAFALAVHDSRSFREFRVTEFWMVPIGEAGSGRVTIGIRNGEDMPIRYEVEVLRDGLPVVLWQALDLAPGESLTRTYDFHSPAGRALRIEARLFKSSNRSRVYRKVWMEPEA